ncbi:[Wnt protein] O-palmitoleoyl-L-serine hydrolase [Salvia divinorum]|uniref:Pectin acetylesterase n=1 Tax=Salvia divinorum TaxID=28513 RepID=A0ABD1H986_SALDI
MGDHNQIRVAPWFKIVYSLLVFIGSQVDGENIVEVNVTFITDAVAKGAVCLDGTPGAYYYYPGFDDGVDNWIFYLPGGAWCDTKEECFWPLMRPNKTLNPDFYNWNAVWIRYCDGASFMADVEAVDPETNLHLRGRRIFASVMEELISTKGMKNAVNAVLFGNSAGGLAAILNCDRFHSFLPDASRVKCISESGFFIRAKDLPGAQDTAIDYFSRTVEFHTIQQAVGDWYFERSSVQLIDTEHTYPIDCNLIVV